MYTDFFGLTAKPFQLTPDPDFYVDTETHHRAMAYLTYGLSQGEGFVIITGDIGAGKTTLAARLLQQTVTDDIAVGHIVTSRLDGSELLRLAARAWGLPDIGEHKSELLNQIEEFLRTSWRQGKRVVLLVDEAQNLEQGALEELRMLSNFQEGGSPLLQTILLGQPEFRQRLARAPDLEQLRQRVVASHHLEPMRRDELQTYVESRLSHCGWTGDPEFTADAYETLYEASQGVPRKINNLGSRLLLFASLEGEHRIDGELVAAVVDDLAGDNADPHSGEKIVPANPAAQVTNGRALADNDGMTALEERVSSLERALKNMLALQSDLTGEVELIADTLETRRGRS